jgi:hypothetical protein
MPVIAEDLFAAEPGFLDAAVEFCAEVGRKFVAEVEMILGDYPACMGIEDDEVRVGAWDECTFTAG